MYASRSRQNARVMGVSRRAWVATALALCRGPFWGERAHGIKIMPRLPNAAAPQSDRTLFLRSPEYQQARKLRAGAGVGEMLVVEGC